MWQKQGEIGHYFTNTLLFDFSGPKYRILIKENILKTKNKNKNKSFQKIAWAVFL